MEPTPLEKLYRPVGYSNTKSKRVDVSYDTQRLRSRKRFSNIEFSDPRSSVSCSTENTAALYQTGKFVEKD